MPFWIRPQILLMLELKFIISTGIYLIIHFLLDKQQDFLSKQIFGKTPTELRYVERSVFTTEGNNQNLWNFNIGSQEPMHTPIRTIITFQQQDREDSQNLKIDTFCRLPVVGTQCIIGTENYPDAGLLLIMMMTIIVKFIVKLRKLLQL